MHSSGTRIEALSKENYDTWKIQMQALLIKNDAWLYVNGMCVKPEITTGDATAVSTMNQCTINDGKAKADIILAINPSELKQVKECETSREVWLKLEEIYQSRGPAKKATLLKQLMLQHMREGDDVREHLRRFFDAADKLNDMEVTINPDLLAIMLLYSLPSNFDNFRCAIESRDELLTPETPRVKIIEEYDARKGDKHDTAQNALFVGKYHKKQPKNKNKSNDPGKSEGFKFKCHRCRKIGHKASECNQKDDRSGN